MFAFFELSININVGNFTIIYKIEKLKQTKPIGVLYNFSLCIEHTSIILLIDVI